MKNIILDREGFLEEISISDRTIWGIESILDKHTIKPEEDRMSELLGKWKEKLKPDHKCVCNHKEIRKCHICNSSLFLEPTQEEICIYEPYGVGCSKHEKGKCPKPTPEPEEQRLKSIYEKFERCDICSMYCVDKGVLQDHKRYSHQSKPKPKVPERVEFLYPSKDLSTLLNREEAWVKKFNQIISYLKEKED